MAFYQPFGPFEIPRKNGIIDTDQLKSGSDFWSEIEGEQNGLSKAHGCYIFSIRASKGIRPWYVGQAKGKKGFRQEILSNHKITHYNNVITESGKGTPIIQLLARITDGKKLSRSVNQNEVNYMETLLIGMALDANPELKNTKTARRANMLIIPGITGGEGQGAPNKAVRELKKTFSI